MFRFSTPAVSFASEPVVFGFEAFDSETLGATSLLSAGEALPFASLAAFAARFSLRLRFLSCVALVGMYKLPKELPSYRFGLMPGPHGLEAVKKADILEQVRIKPESRRVSCPGDTEENEAEDAHK